MSDMQQETATTLANLVTATTSDQTAFITLTTTNADLSRQIIMLTAHLNTTHGKISTLTTQLAAKGGGSSDVNNNSNPRTGTFPGLEPMGYCWSHGWRVRKGHSSSTCSRRKTGHNATATQENTKGGSDYNKGWTGQITGTRR